MNEPTIEDLILAGIIEPSVFDPVSGEILYTFTPKFKDVMPEMYEAHMKYIHEELMYFWERGMINVDDFTSTNPIISLTPAAFDEEKVSELSKDKQQSLAEIKRILKVV